MKSKKVSIYISNSLLKPANYYRIVQYAKEIPNTTIYNIYPTFLFKLTIKYREKRFIRKIIEKILSIVANYRIKKYIKKDLKDLPDYIVVQKSMTKYPINKKTTILREELMKKTTLIWDFDDNIVMDHQIQEEEYNLYCNQSKKIIVTNNFLKETLPKKVQKKVELLPTTDLEIHVKEKELKEINQERLKSYQDKIILVWLATSANIPYLEDILNILESTAKYLKIKNNKQLILKVICDKKIKTNNYYLKIENIKWTRERAIEELKKAHIGIMPLRNNLFTQGKGGFKLIQYIATSLPVIASNVGYNKEIFKKEIGFLVEDETSKKTWKDAIIELSTNNKTWIKCSKNASKTWEEYFNAEENLKYWKNILK